MAQASFADRQGIFWAVFLANHGMAKVMNSINAIPPAWRGRKRRDSSDRVFGPLADGSVSFACTQSRQFDC
jgi:hypothetical protein